MCWRIRVLRLRLVPFEMAHRVGYYNGMSKSSAAGGNLFEAIREAATGGDAPLVVGLTKEAVSSGVDREALLAGMTELMLELRAAGNESAEDLILDTMDCLVGWCSPSSRI